MKLIPLLFLLTACYASGPEYTGHEKGNLIIYRPNTMLFSGHTNNVSVNGHDCDLNTGGFFVTHIDGPTIVTAQKWSMAGTSRVNVKPGDYVRVETSSVRMVGMGVSGIFGGFAGGVAGQGASQGLNAATSNDGPYILTNVPKAQAKQELQGLKQDCM